MNKLKGQYIYASWGYDQTNIDFAQITEVSDTGKTVKARRVKKERGERMGAHDVVTPTSEQYGEEFRLKVNQHGDTITLRGSYPYSVHSDDKRLDTFTLAADRERITATNPYFGH